MITSGTIVPHLFKVHNHKLLWSRQLSILVDTRWNENTTQHVVLNAVLQVGGMQKIVGIIGKNFCQIATLHSSYVLPWASKIKCTKKSMWEIIIFKVWPRNMSSYFSIMNTGSIFWKAIKTSLTMQTLNNCLNGPYDHYSLTANFYPLKTIWS